MRKITTTKADVTLVEPDQVKIQIHDQVELDKEDMLAINAAKFRLVGDKKHIVLFIPGKLGSITQAAREVSASPEVNRNALAKAIVVSTISQRLIGNFFINVNKPPAPTRVFSSEEEALTWLKKKRV